MNWDIIWIGLVIGFYLAVSAWVFSLLMEKFVEELDKNDPFALSMANRPHFLFFAMSFASLIWPVALVVGGLSLHKKNRFFQRTNIKPEDQDEKFF